MTKEKNAWMIEAGDVVDVMPPHRKQPATMGFDRPGDALARAAVVRPARRRIWQIPCAKSGLRFAPLVGLTYLLGPLAILLTPTGRRKKFTVFGAGLSYAATVVLVAFRFRQLVRPDHPGSIWLWSALVLVAVVGGFTAWARAVHLLANEGIPHRNKLPFWLRKNWVISALGLVAPGSGFLLGGRADRAAVALWAMCPAVVSVVVLGNASGLWRHHRLHGWLADFGPRLEMAFMVAAAGVVLGFVVYVVQALEGMRQVLVEPGLKRRHHTDYYVAALAVATVTAVLVVSPVRLAGQLGEGGSALRAEGMQVIPLQLAVTAHRLAPGEPSYAIQTMELCEELGYRGRADAVRGDLDRYYGVLYRARKAVTAADSAGR